MRTRLFALGIVVALVACDAADPTSFGRLRDDADVVVVHNPGGGTGATGFGAFVLGFGTRLPDVGLPTHLVRASRFITSSGAGGPYSVFPAFDEHMIDLRTTSGLIPSAGPAPRYDGCLGQMFCGVGSSVSFAATEIWHQDAATDLHGCVIVPSGSAVVDVRTGNRHEQIQVRCEPTSSDIIPLDVPVERVELGASATSLPPEHPLGAAIFGAPGDAMGAGSLYRLDDYPLNAFVHIDLPGTPNAAGIGRTLASAPLSDGSILLATGGQGRPDDPVVVVATIDPTGVAVLRACLRGHGTRFGSALAFGDFDGDHVPDLAVGAGAWTSEQAISQHVDQPIAMFAGHDLVTGRALGCEDPPATPLAPARSIACANDVTTGFTCAASANDSYAGFGASLAAGDVNADGHDDLIIGVPLSNVHGGGAGVVLVLAGGTTFDAIGQADHALLAYSSIAGGANLGAAVSTLPGVDRMEIVAGAPGQSHVALFFCSGLRGDRPEDFAGMTGVTHGCVAAAHPQMDVDASVPAGDAGPVMDAGVPDAGGLDAGAVDAAQGDAGSVDAGSADASADTGMDAG